MTIEQMRGTLGAAHEFAMESQVAAMARVFGARGRGSSDVTYGEDA